MNVMDNLSTADTRLLDQIPYAKKTGYNNGRTMLQLSFCKQAGLSYLPPEVPLFWNKVNFNNYVVTVSLLAITSSIVRPISLKKMYYPFVIHPYVGMLDHNKDSGLLHFEFSPQDTAKMFCFENDEVVAILKNALALINSVHKTTFELIVKTTGAGLIQAENIDVFIAEMPVLETLQKRLKPDTFFKTAQPELCRQLSDNVDSLLKHESVLKTWYQSQLIKKRIV
jgi:hypothetical protein